MEATQQERLEAVIADGQHATPNTKSGKKDSWFKRFSTRRKSKTDKDMTDSGKPFVGGAALTGASTTSVHNTAAASTNDSAPGTTASVNESVPGVVAAEEETRGRTVERAMSPVSSIEQDEGRRTEDAESEEEFEEARDNFDEALAPPPTFPAEKSSSPSRASKFTEVV